MMSSDGLARLYAASSFAYANISIMALCASSGDTAYSGSSEPIIRFDQSKSW